MPWVILTLISLGTGCAILLQCWSRAFVPFLGGSLNSTSMVLASFLSSLAVGSWLATHRPFLLRPAKVVVATSVIALGILGLVSVRLIDAATPLHSLLYNAEVSDFSQLWRLLRGLLIALQVSIPGVAAGLALTTTARLIYYEDLAHHIVKASLLYSFLFFSILFGVILSGYALFPHLGILQSTYLAGSVLVTIGLAVGVSHLQTKVPSEIPVAESVVPPPSHSSSYFIEVCALLGGFAFLGLLMAWYRILSNIFGATSLALSAVTTVFLIGSGLGSLAASRLVHHTRYSSLEGLYLYGMAGLLSIIASAFVNELPVWYAQLYWSFGGGSNQLGVLGAQVILATVVLLPSTFAFGSVLPYLLKVGFAHHELRSPVVFVVGRMNAYFIIGGILGLISSGMILIQKVGAAKTIVGLGTLMILGGFYLAFGLTKVAVARRFKAVAILSTLALISTLALPNHNPLLTSHGLFAKMRGYKTIEAFSDDRDASISRLLFFEEGLHGSVSVVANEENLGRLALRVNGHLLAGSGLRQRRHLTLLSFLPFVFQPAAREVLVLGLGTGISSGQILMKTSVERVSVVEPEPAMIRAAQWFRFINQEPLRDSRLRIIQEDPRVHLKFSNQRYDVITTDPSDSMVSGNGPLYTAEFYQDVSRRLAPQGVFTQWLQGDGISSKAYLSVLKAFAKTFGNTFVFLDGENTILVGTKQNQPVPFIRWRDLYNDPAIKTILSRDDFASPEAVVSLLFADRLHLRQQLDLAQTPANSDDQLHTEVSFPRSLAVADLNSFTVELAQQLTPGRLESLTRAISGLPLEPVIQTLLERLPPNLASIHPQIYEECLRSLEVLKAKVDRNAVRSWYSRRPSPVGKSEALAQAQADILTAAKNQQAERLITLLRSAFADRNSQIFYNSGVLLGETLLQKARYDEALEVAETMKSEHPAYGSAYHIAAEALIQKNQLARARAVLEEGLFYHPTHQGLTKLYGALSRLPFSGEESPSGH